MVAFLKGDFVNINQLGHIMDSSYESHSCIQGPITASADDLNLSENNQLKSDVNLPPSSTHMGICNMAVIDRVDVDQTTTTVQLLLHRLGLKPKQGFEGTRKQERTIVSYS